MGSVLGDYTKRNAIFLEFIELGLVELLRRLMVTETIKCPYQPGTRPFEVWIAATLNGFRQAFYAGAKMDDSEVLALFAVKFDFDRDTLSINNLVAGGGTGTVNGQAPTLVETLAAFSALKGIAEGSMSAVLNGAVESHKMPEAPDQLMKVIDKAFEIASAPFKKGEDECSQQGESEKCSCGSGC